MRKLLTGIFLTAVFAFAAADPALVRLVMPDARVVYGFDLAHAKQTPFGQFALAQFSASEDATFDSFVKASGFDPRNNLDEIVIATHGGTGRTLAVARGKFDPARILELARNAGADVSSYQGVNIISNGKAATSSPQATPMSVAFLDGALALAGDAESVREAIGRRQSGTGLAPDMVAKVNAASTATDAWFVSTVPIAELAAGLPDPNIRGALSGDALKSIQQMNGGAVFGQTVTLAAEIVTVTPDDAAGLAQVLRFVAGMAGSAQQGGQPNPFAPVLKAIEVKTDGNRLRLALAIPEAQLETLIGQTGSLSR